MLPERNERKLILLILSELSESSFRSGARDVVLPDWLVYKERLGRDAVSTADRNNRPQKALLKIILRKSGGNVGCYISINKDRSRKADRISNVITYSSSCIYENVK